MATDLASDLFDNFVHGLTEHLHARREDFGAFDQHVQVEEKANGYAAEIRLFHAAERRKDIDERRKATLLVRLTEGKGGMTVNCNGTTLPLPTTTESLMHAYEMITRDLIAQLEVGNRYAQ